MELVGDRDKYAGKKIQTDSVKNGQKWKLGKGDSWFGYKLLLRWDDCRSKLNWLQTEHDAYTLHLSRYNAFLSVSFMTQICDSLH